MPIFEAVEFFKTVENISEGPSRRLSGSLVLTYLLCVIFVGERHSEPSRAAVEVA
jgi:hypothetical protein